MSIEEAVAALTRLDATARHLADQQAEIEEEASQLRIYLVVERKFVEVRSKQETDEPASTTASTSHVPSGSSKTRRAMDMATGLIRAAGRPISTTDLLAQMK